MPSELAKIYQNFPPVVFNCQDCRLDDKNLGLIELIDALLSNTIYKSHKNSYLTEVQNAINYRVIYYLMNLARNEKVHGQVNAIANYKLNELKLKLLLKNLNINTPKIALLKEALKNIDSFLTVIYNEWREIRNKYELSKK